MATLLMVISGYSIGEYSIGRYFIGEYFIGGYSIDEYSINGYWWLFRYKPLVVILLVVIDGYFINGY